MEGVDLVEKNIEVKSNEGNKECESFSNDVIFEDLKEEKGLENNSVSSVLDSSSPPRSLDSPNKEVSATDSTSSHGSEVEEKKDLSCENFVKQVSVSPGISNSMNILFTYNVINCGVVFDILQKIVIKYVSYE